MHVVFDNEVMAAPAINRPFPLVRLEQMAKAAGYTHVEWVSEREDMVYEFKDMLKKYGPSMLLMKVTEQAEDVGRVLRAAGDYPTIHEGDRITA